MIEAALAAGQGEKRIDELRLIFADVDGLLAGSPERVEGDVGIDRDLSQVQEITRNGRREFTLTGQRVAESRPSSPGGLNAMTVDVNWRETAACQDADPDLFFPIGAAGPALPLIEEAKRICRACPAQASCLAWALEHGVGSGVWGGTTEDERRALRAGIGRDASRAGATRPGG